MCLKGRYIQLSDRNAITVVKLVILQSNVTVVRSEIVNVHDVEEVFYIDNIGGNIKPLFLTLLQ